MTDATSHAAHTDHDHDDAHPTERQYWLVFIALFVLTAIEVAWSFIGLEGPALVIPLLIMMVIKFFLVAGVFMHLSFDLKIPNGRLFTWAFFGALLLAMLVYFFVFATFDFTI